MQHPSATVQRKGRFNGKKLIQDHQALGTVPKDKGKRMRSPVQVDEIYSLRVQVNEMQFSFMPGKVTTDATFIVREMMEKHLAK